MHVASTGWYCGTCCWLNSSSSSLLGPLTYLVLLIPSSVMVAMPMVTVQHLALPAQHLALLTLLLPVEPDTLLR